MTHSSSHGADDDRADEDNVAEDSVAEDSVADDHASDHRADDHAGDDHADDPLTERVHAHGHEHVSAEHRSTFEVTTDDWLTPAGDCILAVEADRAPAAFADAFVEACQDADATITAQITVRGDTDDRPSHVETVTGRGDPALTFASDRSLVCRTSDHVDDRTVMLHADAAAAEFDRDLVAALAEGADLELRLTVE